VFFCRTNKRKVTLVTTKKEEQAKVLTKLEYSRRKASKAITDKRKNQQG